MTPASATSQTYTAPVSVHDIVNARFTPLRSGNRYSMRDVDEFLARAAATLDGTLSYPESLTAEDARLALFLSAGFFREGYDPAEVDQLTEAIAQTLEDAGHLGSVAGH